MDRAQTIGTTAAAGGTTLGIGTVKREHFTEIDIAFGMLPFDFTIGDFFATAGFVLLIYSAVEAWKSKKERKRRTIDRG